MPLRDIFQFVTANHPSLQKYFGATPEDYRIVFDLEDSIQDVRQPGKNAFLKKQARHRFLEEAQKTGRKKLSFRINSIGSEEFNADLNFLESIFRQHIPGIILLPKLHDFSEIHDCKDALLTRGIFPAEIIPVLETTSVIQQLLGNTSSYDSFTRAIWGHHDYYLEAGIFPFPDQESESYRALTKKIIRALESAGCSYIHGAITALEDETGIIRQMSRLAGLCRKPFDAVALSRSQAASLVNFRLNYSHAEITQNEILPGNIPDAHAYATSICSTYENYLVTGTSIAIHEGHIISPHEYIAAKRYLHALVAERSD